MAAIGEPDTKINVTPVKEPVPEKNPAPAPVREDDKEKVPA